MAERDAIQFYWNGTGMLPINKVWLDRAKALYVDGEVYNLHTSEHRSTASHRHLFAIIGDTWSNLPEAIAPNFPSAEHLRSYALIKAGFCTSEVFSCDSERAALKFAQFMRRADEFAVIKVEGASLIRFVAKSMSRSKMDKDEFGRCKEALLNVLAEIISVPVKDLSKASK